MNRLAKDLVRIAEEISNEENDFELGDGQWHVFDYGEDFPLTERYTIMAPTGDTWPVAHNGGVCPYEGQYSYSTKGEMEDNFAITLDDEEWVPKEIHEPYPSAVKKGIKLIESKLEDD